MGKVATQWEKEKQKQQIWRWLSSLEGNIALPGFAQAFMGNKLCVVLLLKALRVNTSIQPAPVVHKDVFRGNFGIIEDYLSTTEKNINEDETTAMK